MRGEVEPEPAIQGRIVPPPLNLAAVEEVLSDEAAKLLQQARSDNTHRAYAGDWARFSDWCAVNGASPLPAATTTVLNYIAYLTTLGRAPATVERAVSAILSIHTDTGAERPNTRPIREALRAYRKLRAKAGFRPRRSLPITIEILRAMIEAQPHDTPTGQRNRAILTVGYAAMTRRIELHNLNIEDLTFLREGLEVFIVMSKTDRDARGVSVPLPYGSHPGTCPVRVESAWLEILAEHGITSGPVFRAIDKNGRIAGAIGDDGMPVRRAGRGDGIRMTPEAINLVVKEAARAAELPHADRYSAHGLRAGGATDAADAGATMSGICQHGRWSEKSPVVMQYIRHRDKWKNNPMLRVGL
ncbi:tyrosine-type recombinase/integrase [Microbispora bryophytorum]|uniref:tyrosine-type recombinase/integrase n=1 Tax=Microbispora bryophytorum TaxID=1460882 RepID=UPI0033E836BB